MAKTGQSSNTDELNAHSAIEIISVNIFFD